MKTLVWVLCCTLTTPLWAQRAPKPTGNLEARIAMLAAEYETKLLAWRRHLHQNPELSNREVNTAQYIVDALAPLGLEVRTGVARTGVVAILKGGKPGPVVALRADMDALPVTEEVDLPFKSTATAEYNGQTVGVMHACGHDTHVAILIATAHVLHALQAELPGTVVFIFQPAEESAPPDERPAGAEQMVNEGVLRNPQVNAIFGLHVFSSVPTGVLAYRSGPLMAAVDEFTITVQGRQTHGARPWNGVDPIVVGSQIVLGLQTIASRQVDVTLEPSVITVGKFTGGVRNNIIPDSVTLWGTIRTFDPTMQADIHRRIARTAEGIAQSAGAAARVAIVRQYPATVNHPELSAWADGVLKGLVSPSRVVTPTKQTGAEDFSFFQQQVPGFYFSLGVTPPEDLASGQPIPLNHSPRFYVDERALKTGVEAMSTLALRFLQDNPTLSLPAR
ncbi:MAG: amidohydrolase [Bacteroidia bacterium]|nr:amidohydrolase [Bacteroidia bacterium]